MRKNTEFEMFAVVLNGDATSIVNFVHNKKVKQLSLKDIEELVNLFAEKDDVWADVLIGKVKSVIFDANSLEMVCIND